MTKEEELEEKVVEILKYAETGLNKDSISAIMLLNREIDCNESIISSLLSGTVWAEYEGDRDVEDMDLDLFLFHLTDMHPMDEEEIFRYQEQENINIIENLEYKLPCLLNLQSFLEAGMEDSDAIELFNRYFPEAEIDIEDCNFVRKSHQKIDKEIEKELEEKSREIVDIMKKNLKNRNKRS